MQAIIALVREHTAGGKLSEPSPISAPGADSFDSLAAAFREAERVDRATYNELELAEAAAIVRDLAALDARWQASAADA